MIQRQLNPLATSSFFLFGARGTGKSTWLKTQFKALNPLRIDLLDPDQEDRYVKDPKTLEFEILDLISRKTPPDWVIIDEVQKAPRLLDVAHRLIESKKIKFVLTGSSSRKLKRGHANLLGGRASVYALFPFTHDELGASFDLDSALCWGTLPKIHLLSDEREKISSLRSYTQTYLKEEILVEQLVRNLPPFKNFLEIAAQMNCERLNYEKIARDISVENRTVQSYFEILEDTFLGLRLPAFHLSIRKSQRFAPKFYWFDPGVQRFLNGSIHSPLTRGTSAYGEAFESFVVNEIIRASAYRELDYRASFLETKHGAEIDLILSRGREHWAIEIKSTARVDAIEAAKLEAIARDIPGKRRLFYLSQDGKNLRIGQVECMHWMEFFNVLK